MRESVTEIDYREIMYGFLAETTSSPCHEVKVHIPELYVDKPSVASEWLTGVPYVFVNATQVPLSSIVAECTYIKMEVLHASRYNGVTWLQGSRLVLNFINKDPKNGIIICGGGSYE